MLLDFSKDWAYIKLTSKTDKEKVFDYLTSEEILKKLMPCYLQSVDSFEEDINNDQKKIECISSQLNSIYFSKSPPITESSFLESSPTIECWSDESFYMFRRDLVILDNHKLIDFYGSIRNIENFKDATESLAKYTASYIKTLVYPLTTKDYENEGMYSNILTL